MFHIFIDLHERAPVNLFDKYISPYLSLENNSNVQTRQKDAQVIADHIKELLKEEKFLKYNDALVYEELVIH